MKHLQKSLSLFLCIILCLSFFPFSAAYAEEADSEGVASDQDEIPILEEIDTTGETKLKDDSLVTEEEDDSVSETVMKEDLEWTLDDGGAMPEASALAEDNIMYLPSKIIVPTNVNDVSDETMTTYYEYVSDNVVGWSPYNPSEDVFSDDVSGILYYSNEDGFLYELCMQTNGDGFGQLPLDTLSKYFYVFSFQIDKDLAKSSHIFDLTMLPYMISYGAIGGGGYRYVAYADGTIREVYYRTDDGMTYIWIPGVDDSWWYVDKNNGNRQTFVDIDIEKRTDAIPPCTVRFTGETLVLWNDEPSHEKTDSNELVLDNDGVYRVYKDGVFQPITGFIQYEGGLFYVTDGILDSSANGLKNNPDDPAVWYFCANGQVQQQYSGLAEYDGAWFYLSNGVLDTTSVGIVNYDGGRFMIAAGRILREVDGLIQDPNTGLWYYVAAGQVADYTGLAQYDGAWFYITDGMLAVTYTGWVNYDGSDFYVENGMVAYTQQGQSDLVWLSATGDHYHSKPDCGRMDPNRAFQVTRQEAFDRGMTACDKCW